MELSHDDTREPLGCTTELLGPHDANLPMMQRNAAAGVHWNGPGPVRSRELVM